MLLIIAILILSAIMLIHSQTNNKGMTAMEAKTEADKIAFEWNTSATFMGCGPCGDVNSEGKADCWSFSYQDRMDGNGTYEFNVKIYYGGHYETEVLWLNAPSSTQGIENWTIDSDEAYSIAMKNEEIKSFMERYHGAHVDSFSLSGRQDGNPVWSIEWVDWGIWDDPHWAEIRMDATTGEVLYVEAAPGGSSSLSMQDICIGAFVVLIAVVAAAVLMARKKSRENEEKMRIKMEKRNLEKEIRQWDERNRK